MHSARSYRYISNKNWFQINLIQNLCLYADTLAYVHQGRRNVTKPFCHPNYTLAY